MPVLRTLLPGLLLPALLPLAGCIMHDAEARVPPMGADDRGEAWLGTQVQTLSATQATTRRERHQRPVSMPVTVYVKPAAKGGTMLRHEGAVQTPLPWWDCFPCDLACDFWPQEVTVRSETTVEPRPVVRRTREELAAEARAHGYAPEH